MSSFALQHKAVAVMLADWDQGDAVMFAENQPENPPNDKTWMRWSLRPASTFPSEVTAQFDRTVGILYVQIFTPETKGTRAAHDLADKLKPILNEARVVTEDGALIRFDFVQIQYAGRDASGWTQHNCLVPYLVDGVATNAA
jgi:hypothetical protein